MRVPDTFDKLQLIYRMVPVYIPDLIISFLLSPSPLLPHGTESKVRPDYVLFFSSAA